MISYIFITEKFLPNYLWFFKNKISKVHLNTFQDTLKNKLKILF